MDELKCDRCGKIITDKKKRVVVVTRIKIQHFCNAICWTAKQMTAEGYG